MKRFFFWFGVVVSCTTVLHAWNPPDGVMNITTDTRTVSVSTTSASPTRLLTKTSFVQGNYFINLSTCSVSVSTGTTITISSAFAIQGSSPTAGVYTQWSPDGVNSPYQGDLYGLSQCAGASSSSMSIFRSK